MYLLTSPNFCSLCETHHQLTFVRICLVVSSIDWLHFLVPSEVWVEGVVPDNDQVIYTYTRKNYLIPLWKNGIKI